MILESMKMEMPVEAEDDGTVKEIVCQEGSRCPRATRSSSWSDRASSSSTSRPTGVARLTISNPERRGALDHEILDALAGHAHPRRAVS